MVDARVVTWRARSGRQRSTQLCCSDVDSIGGGAKGGENICKHVEISMQKAVHWFLDPMKKWEASL